MAKLKMKCIELVAPINEGKKLMDFLQLRGVIELKEIPPTEGLSAFSTDKAAASIGKYRDTVSTALKVLDRFVPEHTPLTAALKGLPEIGKDEFLEKADKADDALSICFEICENDKAIASAKARLSQIETSRQLIEPWLNLDVPMKFAGTKSTACFIGTLPADYTAESLDTALAGILKGDECLQIEVVSHSRDKTCVFILCDKAHEAPVLSALRTVGFAFPSDPTKHPPRVRYDRLGKEAESLTQQIQRNEENIIALAKDREMIKFAFDYYTMRLDKYEALKKVYAGDSILALQGYIPEENVASLTEQLEKEFDVAYEVTEPGEDENVPVKFRNNAFAGAVESITEMYSMPGKDDIDPNPVMAFFYYMLFGIMLSDAGYGLLMALGCGIAKAKFKLKGQIKKTVDMYFYCGLATVFWGALFGSWFGDIITRVASEFFGIANIGQVWNAKLGFTLFRENIALWFEPVNNPTKLLLFSFLFGIVHLFFGVAASMVKMWKVGNKVGAICDGIPVFLLVSGVAPIGANIISAGTFSDSVTGVAKWVALAGAALIVLTSGRDSKNIAGKLGLGLYGLYNAASGWLSDILSYSRLLALGLCTGVIATVINILGTIPEDKTTKLILLIPVFIFGHVVNMAINLIGTYVHTNRLQYVEFFAKFYEGGGRSFTPLKSNTKFFSIKEDSDAL